MSTSQETMSAIAILTSSIAFSKFLVKLCFSGMPTFQHATMRSPALPGVEAPACGGLGAGMAPASEGPGRAAGRNHGNGTDTTFMISKKTQN